MHRVALLATLLATACAQTDSSPVDVDPDEAGDIDGGKGDGVAGIPDVQCNDAPAIEAGDFRHTHNKLIAALGDSRHRGLDLMTTAGGEQVIEGDLSYGLSDKALEDEDVDVYACRAHQWRLVGTARTDDEGHFALALSGSKRLRLGMRDMYMAFRGDQTGAKFVALVANEGAPLAISDVDGTLTSSEAAFGATIILDIDVSIHDNAPRAFQIAAAKGYQPVYVTARSRAWTETTRRWLASHDMPRGPLRLSPHTVLPGDATVEYKSTTLDAMATDGFEMAIGNGNRASDITAYQQAGVPAEGISIKLPEFEGEVADQIAAGAAFGFEDYADLAARFEQLPTR